MGQFRRSETAPSTQPRCEAPSSGDVHNGVGRDTGATGALVLLGRHHISLDQIVSHAVYRRCGEAHRDWACDSREGENPPRVAESTRSPGKRERALKWSVAILILQAKILRSFVRSLEGISIASGHLESSCVHPGREGDRKG